jgi:hypothetical protein
MYFRKLILAKQKKTNNIKMRKHYGNKRKNKI